MTSRRLTVDLPSGADATRLESQLDDVGATATWRSVVVYLPDEPARSIVERRVRDAIVELGLSPESIVTDEWIEAENRWSSEIPSESRRSWIPTLLGRLVEGLLDVWP